MTGLKDILIRIFPVLQVFLTMIWLSNLASTDAYFSVYVMIAFLSFYFQISSFQKKSFRLHEHTFLCTLLAGFFSVIVLMANYPIFTTIGDPALIGRSTSVVVNLINIVLSFFGGIFTAYPILIYLFHVFPIKRDEKINWLNQKWVAWVVFASFLCINIIHLFLVEYPGNVTEDPFTQISEMVTGSYSNFNTFWHTMLLRFVLSVGFGLFGDLNAAIAFFCVFQIIVLAAAFTYSLVSLRDFGVPGYFIVSAYMVYALIPYHIALSITIWKDVLFAAGCLLIVTSWLRILRYSAKNSILDYILFVLGSLLFLLSRTNGWIIYLASFVLVLLVSRSNKRFLSVMGAMALLGWFLLNPVLSFLNVPGGDSVESLSIPIQQVSRVIAEGCELTDEEEILLSHILDLEDVPQLYTSWLSDPMKAEIRSKDVSYFQDHLSDYGALWVQLGCRYPVQYLKAWIDQTKGYWNGGYDYFLYAETITDNPYGVVKSVGSNPVAALFRLYFGLSRHVIFFEPLHSIGLHVWVFFLCFVLNIVKKRNQFIVSVPLLLLVLGLCLGTPVYCSFRYVYPLFVSFPLILSTTLYSSNT